MARPRKTGLDYFPHDTDAASDEKIAALLAKFGADGYAVYFYLLERIYRENGQLHLQDHLIDLYSAFLQIEKERFLAIIETAVNFGCFDRPKYVQNKILTSNGIEKRLQSIENQRQKKRQYYQKYQKMDEKNSFGRVLDVQNPVLNSFRRPKLTNININKKENKRGREKENIKEKERNTLPPSPNFIFSLDNVRELIYKNIQLDCKAEILDENEIKAFYDYYQSQGWVHANGRPVSDIPAAFARWLKRGNKPSQQGQPEMKKPKESNEIVYQLILQKPDGKKDIAGISYPKHYTPNETDILNFIRKHLRCYYPQHAKAEISVKKTGEKAFTVKICPTKTNEETKNV